jgi:hypothetical protein
MTTKVSYGVANIASQAEAEAGTAVDKFMTPERAAQALVAQAPASAQIMTFSGDSSVTITPNVVDGIYRITGALRPSVDQFIYLQTSDDGGVNFLDTAGDTYTVAWFERSSGSAFSSQDYPSEPGFRLKITGGGSTAEESAFFQALLWFNGSNRIGCAVSGPSFDTSGFLYTHYANGVNTTGGPHATGIDRIRIVTSAGTATGTVIVENLRLS